MSGRQTLLDLGAEHQEIRNILFPEASFRVDLQDVKKLIEYSATEDAKAVYAKCFFEKYLDELSQRGNERSTLIYYYWGIKILFSIVQVHI